jgi:hypothetical protein
MGRHTRKSEINRRRQRRQKLKSVRKRYTTAKTESERSKQVEKLRRVAPGLTKDWFQASSAPAAAKA